MVGAIIIVLMVVVIMPISFMMLGAIISAIFGAVLKSNAEAAHEGSELIETNY